MKKKKTIPRTKRFLEMNMLIAYGRLNFIENVSKWLFINSQLWMCRLMATNTLNIGTYTAIEKRTKMETRRTEKKKKENM